MKKTTLPLLDDRIDRSNCDMSPSRTTQRKIITTMKQQQTNMNESHWKKTVKQNNKHKCTKTTFSKTTTNLQNDARDCRRRSWHTQTYQRC